jgi:hypothetical protein
MRSGSLVGKMATSQQKADRHFTEHCFTGFRPLAIQSDIVCITLEDWHGSMPLELDVQEGGERMSRDGIYIELYRS